MKKLPIGIQDFRKLRERGYLYVDKTKEIYRLSAQAGYYFLSRPRRFGKSMLVSTLKELYSGSRELFEGLWIEDKWDWSKQYSILHIPFSSLGYKELGLERALHRHLDKIIDEHDLGVQEESLSQKFEEVLKSLSKGNQQVVLLIDEYDKPIIDYLGKKIDQAVENQQILKNFYSIIKDADPWLHLVFITGVSKFSKVSIFSDLNNLNDITLHPAYAEIAGYTQMELEAYFAGYIKELAEKHRYDKAEALEKIKNWYNGYSWDAQTFVYNPFSILLLFDSMTFATHWFRTATPTFLIDLIKEKAFYDYDGMEVSEAFFDAFEISKDIQLGTLLFQTGYLTIKKYNPDWQLYTVGYPNYEVKKSMLEYLLSAFANFETGLGAKPVMEAYLALKQEDIEKLKEILNDLLYNIPYHLHEKTERFYHLVLHVFFDYIGLNVRSEMNTSRGRADAVVELDDKVYCLEFKLDRSAEEALEQIKERAYLDKYRSSGKKLIAIGINFSSEKREIDGVKVSVC